MLNSLYSLALNRMASHKKNGAVANYTYRADGMRTEKASASSDYTAYYYDGQMPMEEYYYMAAHPSFTSLKVLRYGLGARGVDRIERALFSGTVLTVFPIYDGHGNKAATILRNGSSYALEDQRSYDAWGKIRTGNTTGEPNARYIANLGHLQDDESGLVYMRARYYEPGTGRFITEDPARDGRNWCTYARNNPVNGIDFSGKATELSDIANGLWWISR